MSDAPSPPSAPIRILAVAPVLAGGSGAEAVTWAVIDALARDPRFAVTVWTTRAAGPFHPGKADETAFAETLARLPCPTRVWPQNTVARRLLGWARRSLEHGRQGTMISALAVRGMLQGSGMARALKRDLAAFDLVYLPHLHYGTALRLAPIAGNKAVVHPFAHDEPLIRTPPVRRCLARAGALVLNSDAEASVLRGAGNVLPGRVRTIGNPVSLDLDAARHSTILDTLGLAPQGYLLYVGRLSGGKNLRALLAWRHAEAAPLPLVLVTRDAPETLRRRFGVAPGDEAIVFAGDPGEADKAALYRGCLAVAQPSLLESFSLVVMEGWLAGRPAIVHPRSTCVAEHAARSGGALYAENEESWREAVACLRHPQAATRLGENGRAYVMANFTQEAFRATVCKTFADLASGPTARGKP